MRRLICILLLSPISLWAISLSLAWDPESDPTVVGYRIYYGSESGAYTNLVDAGSSTSITISNLVPGVTYFFAATAYDGQNMESSYSTEVSYNVPPGQVPPPVVLLNAQIGGGIIVTSSVPVSP